MVIVKRMTLAAAVSAFAVAAMVTSANAASTQVDPNKVQALAGQLETTLAGLACSATAESDVTALQATITASGDDPWVARAALRMAEHFSPAVSSCPTLGAALASVDQTINQALEGSSVPHAGPAGPSGGTPIGAPASYVSGGGSDYLP